MEQVQRTVIVSCPSCGQKNRIADRSGLPCCGACQLPLPPIPPVRPARPVWISPLAFMRYFWEQRRYMAANRRFRRLEEERQCRAEEARQRQEEERRRRAQKRAPTTRRGAARTRRLDCHSQTAAIRSTWLPNRYRI